MGAALLVFAAEQRVGDRRLRGGAARLLQRGTTRTLGRKDDTPRGPMAAKTALIAGARWARRPRDSLTCSSTMTGT